MEFASSHWLMGIPTGWSAFFSLTAARRSSSHVAGGERAGALGLVDEVPADRRPVLGRELLAEFADGFVAVLVVGAVAQRLERARRPGPGPAPQVGRRRQARRPRHPHEIPPRDR